MNKFNSCIIQILIFVGTFFNFQTQYDYLVFQIVLSLENPF